MKQKLVGSITLSIIAMLFLSMMSILPVHALPQEIYMVPSANNFTTGPPGVVHAPGYRWNITVYVKDAPAFTAYQVYLTVDDTMLNITNAWLPFGDPTWVFAGRTTMLPSPAFYDADMDLMSEAVKIGDVIIVGAAASGAGKLAIIELEILKAPGKFEPPLTCPLSIDSLDTYLLDPDGVEIPDLAKTNGSYSYSWNPPTTMPNLAVSPTLVTFGPDPPTAIGQQFDIEVWIENLDLGWGITAAMFDLNYNTTVIDTTVPDVTINTADWDGPFSVFVLHDPLTDTVSIFVSTTQSLSGNVLVATIKFTVMMQEDSPPKPMGYFDHSDLTFCFSMLEDHIGPIPTAEPVEGLVKIFALRTLPIAWISLDPEHTVLGPDLVVGPQFGKEFTINVNINDLDAAWRLIGLQTKLTFDSELMEVVSVEEGPFLPSFPEPGQIPPTWFTSYVEIDGPWGDFIEFADLKLSVDGTYSNFPEGAGTVAIIRFRAIKQSWVTPLTHQFVAWDCLGVDDNVQDVPIIGGDVGTYTVLPVAAVGRRIDLWMQYPSPYGGQGLNQYADLVIPQQEIYLTAKVTYNWYPVENKKVTFEVRDNQGNVVVILSDVTDAEGHAHATFRMPAEIESLFGVWTVTASVSVAEVVIIDTMQFHFDDLVRIWDVTTDKLEYAHLETMTIRVYYGTHAIQSYGAVITIAIKDELDVPIGIAWTVKTVGGSIFSVYKNYVSTFTVQIPHSAYAGLACVHANVLTGLPPYGGTAVTWEVDREFYILPY